MSQFAGGQRHGSKPAVVNDPIRRGPYGASISESEL
jgi:hypothetical protein